VENDKLCSEKRKGVKCADSNEDLREDCPAGSQLCEFESAGPENLRTDHALGYFLRVYAVFDERVLGKDLPEANKYSLYLPYKKTPQLTLRPVILIKIISSHCTAPKLSTKPKILINLPLPISQAVKK
jgi:hypothetical protein